MRNVTRIVCSLIVLSILLQLGIVPTLAQAESNQPAQRFAFENFPLNQPRQIQFEIPAPTVEQLTRRERLDQLRDWLLFTVVADAGLTVEEMNQSLYDLPPIRYGYMQRVANFDYGAIRSLYIGQGQVIALTPADAGKEQADLLAAIADQHRKNSGEIPETLIWFEYTLQPDEQTALVTRLESVPAQDLFTAEAGYFEANITDATAFQEFLTRIDDITYAHFSPVGLTLGGRKLIGHVYRAITLEDVAAIWQATDKIHTELAQLDAWSDGLVAEFKARWAQTTYQTDKEKRALEQQQDQEWEALQKQVQDEYLRRKPATGLGFSLDPVYDYAGLSAYITTIKPILETVTTGDVPAYAEQYCTLILQNALADEGLIARSELTGDRSDLERALAQAGYVGPEGNSVCIFLTDLYPDARIDSATLLAITPPMTSGDIEQAMTGIALQNIDGYLALFEKITQSESPLIAWLGQLLYENGEAYRFQAARYEGDLQGTTVGMNLFYTDLLAKLWALNYQGSAPSQSIDEFKAMTQATLSPIFQAELEELSHTRLWFGHQDRGFQLADDRESLLFARNAVRVYAASANQFTPGIEVEPNAQSAAFLGWWDDHYEEIARYEPEYERLNEIMKWSLITMWLYEDEQGARLGFLNEIPVQHDLWFPDWARAHPGLTFRAWDTLGFFPKGYIGLTTEALPQLASESYALFGDERRTLTGGVSLASTDLLRQRAALSPIVNVLSRRSNLKYDALSPDSQRLQRQDGVQYDQRSIASDQASTTASVPETARLRTATSELASHTFQNTIVKQPDGYEIHTSIEGIAQGNLRVKIGQTMATVWQSRDIDAGYALARQLSVASDPLALLGKDAHINTIIAGRGESYIIKLDGSEQWVKFTPEAGAQATMGHALNGRAAERAPNAKVLLVAFLREDAVLAELRNAEYVTLESVPGSNKSLVRANPIRGPPTGSQVREILLDGQAVTIYIDPNGVIYLSTATLPVKQPGDLKTLFDKAALVPAAESLAAELEPLRPLLQSDKPADAQRLLEQLINKYGPRPELTLRMGIIKIKQGNLTEGAKLLNETPFELLSERGGPAIFDDIFGDAAARSHNLQRIHDSIKARQEQPMKGLQWQLAAENDVMLLDLHLAETTDGKPITRGAYHRAPLIYAPRDLAIDWLASLQITIQGESFQDWGHIFEPPKLGGVSLASINLFDSDKVVVFEFPVRQVSSYHPDRIFMPDGRKLLPVNDSFAADGAGSGGDEDLPPIWIVLAVPIAIPPTPMTVAAPSATPAAPVVQPSAEQKIGVPSSSQGNSSASDEPEQVTPNASLQDDAGGKDGDGASRATPTATLEQNLVLAQAPTQSSATMTTTIETATSTSTTTPNMAATSVPGATPYISVEDGLVDLRKAPDLAAVVAAQIGPGLDFSIVERTDDGRWLRICCVGTSSFWVLAEEVVVHNDIAGVPHTETEEAPEETPTPSLTPSPSLTPTPSFTPTPSNTPTATATAYAIAETGLVELRRGPGATYPLALSIGTDFPLIIVGRNADTSWLLVCCVNAQELWVEATAIAVYNDPSGAPLITPPPTLTPTATATFTPTPTPTDTPTPTNTPTPAPTPFAQAVSGKAMLREGPAASFPVLAEVGAGLKLAVVGRTADSRWLQVCCIAISSFWVDAAQVEIGNDVATAPIITPPPSPTPTPSETPTRTPTSSPTPRVMALTKYATVSASATAPDGKDSCKPPGITSFAATNLVDDNASTAWRVVGSAAADYIDFHFDEPVVLQEMRIIPGYAKTDPCDPTLYWCPINHIPKRVQLTFDDNVKVEFILEERCEQQRITWQPLTTRSVRLQVLETYLPSSARLRRDFTPISEVELWGYRP